MLTLEERSPKIVIQYELGSPQLMYIQITIKRLIHTHTRVQKFKRNMGRVGKGKTV